MDYKYGNKKQWRRWVWNRIAERTPNRRDALVLFLAGENAHDVAEAERRGFRRANMIAVERDAQTLKKLREDGLLAIEGDICEVLRNWPSSRSVAVVLADLCCGLEMRVVQAIRSLDINPAFGDATLAVNVLRGRDSSTNAMRACLKGSIADDKHRGVHLFTVLASGLCTCWGQASIEQEQFEKRYEAVVKIMRPVSQSYRSTAGNQVFDTAVWKNITGELARRSPKVASIFQEAGKLKPDVDGAGQRRRTAAVLAHHTMRQQRTRGGFTSYH